VVAEIQAILDSYCLAVVHINLEANAFVVVVGQRLGRVYLPLSCSSLTVFLSGAPPNRSAYPNGVHSTISSGRS